MKRLLLIGVLAALPFARLSAADQAQVETDATAQRYAVAVTQAAELIAAQYVEQKKPGDLTAWAIDELYRLVNEKLPDDLRERVRGVNRLSDVDRLVLLSDARARLGKRPELDGGNDLNASLDGITRRLDPYSKFTDAAAKAKSSWSQWTNFSGAGVTYQIDQCMGFPVVVTPLKGSPAHRAGIQEGDIITRFGVYEDEQGWPLSKPRLRDAKGMATEEIERILIGQPGTRMTITVDRPGEDKPREFALRREVFELESVLGVERRADTSWNYLIDARHHIGYVRLANFYDRDLARKLSAVLQTLEGEGLTGLILDLRFNPGGRVNVGVDVAGLFLGEDQLIVNVQSRAKEERHVSRRAGQHTQLSLVVLINGESASVSEMVAACLQDHRRALIVGERSFGKGTVQQIFPIDQAGELKLTMARWRRPNGNNLDKAYADNGNWGVRPNRSFEIVLSKKQRDDLFRDQYLRWVIARRDIAPPARKSDTQLERALEWLRADTEE